MVLFGVGPYTKLVSSKAILLLWSAAACRWQHSLKNVSTSINKPRRLTKEAGGKERTEGEVVSISAGALRISGVIAALGRWRLLWHTPSQPVPPTCPANSTLFSSSPTFSTFSRTRSALFVGPSALLCSIDSAPRCSIQPDSSTAHWSSLSPLAAGLLRLTSRRPHSRLL